MVTTTGIVGVADAQTARLNLLNIGPAAPPQGTVCTANVSFLDADGNIVKSGSLIIQAGKSAALEARSDTDLNLTAGGRMVIRAQISVSGTTLPPAATTQAVQILPSLACVLVPTLEIYDTVSGRTVVLLGQAVTGFSIGL